MYLAAIGLYFDLSLHLHLNFVYASNEGSGVSEYLHRSNF